MMKNNLKHVSKFLSLVLRHQPELIDLQLDENGWTSTDELLRRLNSHKGMQVDMRMLEELVATNDKQRFSFNNDNTRIRANQGHSIEIELNLEPAIPPDILYHGTAAQFLESILKTGLQKRNRQHVHLSATQDTAKMVGSRHGKPVILSIRAKAMFDAGYVFFLSANKVWLTAEVPVAYIFH